MKLRLVLTAFVVSACAANALAHHFRFTANLTGSAEAPPNSSSGIGHVILTLDVDEGTMEVEATFAELAGTVTEVHIHAPTTAVGSGIADAATQQPSFTDFPMGVPQGDYDHEFDLSQSGTYSPAFFAASGGTTGDALGALFNSMQAGKAYFDIHTTAFADGEIRGFLSYAEGDYNDNGIVDAADYVVWRKTLGDIGEGLKADSNNDNIIDPLDYDAWRENFGHAGLSAAPASGAGFGSNVPEPQTAPMATIALLTLGSLRLHKHAGKGCAYWCSR
jgi:hypothetical protein